MGQYIEPNVISFGRVQDLLRKVRKQSVALSVWSLPVMPINRKVWYDAINDIFKQHKRVLKCGGFMVVHAGDRITQVPRYYTRTTKTVSQIDAIHLIKQQHPSYRANDLAEQMNISARTVYRLLKRGRGREDSVDKCRVELVGGFLEECARRNGLYLFDRRIWQKPFTPSVAATARKGVSTSADEFDYLYIFWKPSTTLPTRRGISLDEWEEWGSRGIWATPPAPKQRFYEAAFPSEIARRLVRLYSDEGDVVLSPFVGHGNIIIAAKLLNRQYIGFDRDEYLVELTKCRLENRKHQSRMIYKGFYSL